jgi:DNA mismatch repair protein MutL
MGNIRILENSVALKIAAGEVIDRPASVLRELLDNSIDAGSSDISVYIESAGIREIRITDNGAGMDSEDLEICVMPHATSKIRQAEDLYRIKTLGFRGEALSSIAASSRLEITTCTNDYSEGYTLKTDSSGRIDISAGKARKGTTVSVRDLFYAFPARKQFLKNPSAETSLCKSVFYEKAAARPDITFRLYIDNILIQMMHASSLKERIFMSYNNVFSDESLIYEAYEPADNGNLYSITAVMADPSLFRKDRKYIHIYLNGRRIQEYSLLQAVVYGYSSFLPGGHYPCAAVFIENSPELVDFNIHPAKKEAKIKNIKQIHHSVTELIIKNLKEKSYSGMRPEKLMLPAGER